MSSQSNSFCLHLLRSDFLYEERSECETIPKGEASVSSSSANFWRWVEDYRQMIDADLERAMERGVLIAEPEPQYFLAAALASLDRAVPIILGNPLWGEVEWQSFSEQFSPALVFGLEGRNFPERSVSPFNASDRGLIAIPTGGSRGGSLRFALHYWANLKAQSAILQDFLGSGAIHSFCCLPLYHVSGWMQIIRAIVTGGQIVLHRFDALDHVLSMVEASEGRGLEEFCLSLVPTQLERCLLQGGSISALKKMRAIFLGGGPTSEELSSRARAHGLPIVLTYGMTETAGMICAQSASDFLSGAVSALCPLNGVEIGFDQSEGVPQIKVSSPSLFYGYWGQSEWVREEGFLTGDRGRWIGDGQLVIEGRIDNWIISGGEKINPREVEAVLLETKWVAAAMVVGKASPEWGQAVVALIVPSACGGRDSEAQLRAHLKKYLSDYKQPKSILYVKQLPLLENGKVDPSALAAVLAYSE